MVSDLIRKTETLINHFHYMFASDLKIKVFKK